MLRAGYLSLSTWWGVPVRLHLATLLVAALAGSFQLVPGVWVGVLLLTLIHELGHALLVRLFRSRVVGIDLSAVGGRCRGSGEVSAMEYAIIAWGGVLAQAIVLLPTLAMNHFAWTYEHAFVAELAFALTTCNAMLIAVNLLPIGPLDGADAWPLLRLLWRRLRRGKARPTGHELPRMSGDVSDGQVSPEIKAQLDRIMAEAWADAARKGRKK